MKKIFFFLILIIMMNSCKEKIDNPVAESKIYFSGLTQTDNNGWPISIDSTDWTTNDTWVKKESDLFTNVYQSNCTQSFANHIAQYPNPCNGIFTLSFSKPATTRIELRLVDKNFNPIYSNDSVLGNAVQFNAGAFGIKDTVRLYYKFIENNCEFRGHGDILVK
jgi:hypothetical protein